MEQFTCLNVTTSTLGIFLNIEIYSDTIKNIEILKQVYIRIRKNINYFTVDLHKSVE